MNGFSASCLLLLRFFKRELENHHCLWLAKTPKGYAKRHVRCLRSTTEVKVFSSQQLYTLSALDCVREVATVCSVPTFVSWRVVDASRPTFCDPH